MSHWVHSPVITDLVSGEVLLDLSGSPWDLVGTSSNGSFIELSLRKYPGSGEIVVVRVSAEPRMFQFNGKTVAGSKLLELLDAHV